METSIMAIPKQGFVVAIDGPAGTGKSSATRRLSDLLGFTYVDTGALYRSIAYLMVKRGLTPEHTEQATELARSIHLEFKRAPKKNPANRIFADSQDVTEFIRTPEVSMAASQISAIPGVRAALLGLQRRMGCVGKTILEGRDIGTVIFPDADIKFFLTASVDERAKRRLAELEALGSDALSFEEVKRQIVARDHGDSSRAVAPLKKAADAVELDTSNSTLDEVVLLMESKIRERMR
jgi:CMP/dCMP kinase